MSAYYLLALNNAFSNPPNPTAKIAGGYKSIAQNTKMKVPKKRSSLVCSVRSPLEKTRYDTSLGLLTKKFVGLLRSAPDGVLDLNKVL